MQVGACGRGRTRLNKSRYLGGGRKEQTRGSKGGVCSGGGVEHVADIEWLS